MYILAINTGSTSTELTLFEHTGQTLKRLCSDRRPADDSQPEDRLKAFLADNATPDILAHRVVHGGEQLLRSQLITPDVEAAIEQLSDLAPLHNPVALRWIIAARRLLGTPQVAVFDTAFFASMPDLARHYALPRDIADRHAIRRYGFHGLAHRAMWRRWCALRPDLDAGGRLISLQLGGGCSIAAIRDGVPQDTSMGFSPAEGLVMAKRCGDVDAGAIVHLQKSAGMTSDAVEAMINQQSGLLGISGISGDLRDLIDSTDERAQLAVALYGHRMRKYIGAYLAVLEGADGIVFGGGVGIHMHQPRLRALHNMDWCGIRIDPQANRHVCGEEGLISTPDSRIEVRVIPPDEASLLAEEAFGVINEPPAADEK